MSSQTRLPRLVLGLVLLGLPTAGCDQIQALLGGGAETAAAEAEGLLKQGDLPGAADAYTAAAAEHPTDVSVATGAAYSALLQGDTDAADAYLAAAEAEAGEALGEVKLRRALVALEAGDLESVKQHGEASGKPMGALLAAEVALADGEAEEAEALLGKAKAGGGAVGQTAQAYLDLLASEEPTVRGLSEAQALWALGEHKIAVRSVEELVKGLPDDREDREELVLLWSGRAASVDETDVARSILDALIFPPEGQAWRKVATQGIIACAEGDAAACQATFKTLEGNAPEDGLADAVATAAFLIADEDPEAAKALAGRYVSNASARALLEAGDAAAARESVPGGVLGEYLKAGG